MCSASTSVERGETRERREGGLSSFVHAASNRGPGLERDRAVGAAGRFPFISCRGQAPACCVGHDQAQEFIYWLSWVFTAGLSLVVASRGYSSLPCAGFSCCRGRSLEGRFSSGGAWV